MLAAKITECGQTHVKGAVQARQHRAADSHRANERSTKAAETALAGGLEEFHRELRTSFGCDLAFFTVNSSLSAVPVYQAFGFVPAGSIQSMHGISFLPMQRPALLA